jgi:uncharacterized membrane protein YciS (DUF1049 family)
MDSDFTKLIINDIHNGLQTIMFYMFILGIVFTLIIGSLICGGIYLYHHYSIVKVEQTTNSSTNSVIWHQK